MSDKLTNFKQAMEKYKLTDPANPETRSRMSSYKKNDLQAILKKTGSYSIPFAIIASVYFFFKKIGLGISIMKSAIIVSIGTVTIVATVSTGAYYTVKHVIKEDKQDQQQQKPDNPEKDIPKTDNTKPIHNPADQPNVTIINEYGLVPLSAENAPPELATKATSAIFNALKAKFNKEKIILIDAKKQNVVNRMIIGSIEKIDNSYSISVRLVQVNNAKILKIAAETVDSEDKIINACKKISKKLLE